MKEARLLMIRAEYTPLHSELFAFRNEFLDPVLCAALKVS